MKTKILYIILPVLLLTSCGSGTQFSEYQSLPLSGWNKDSVMTFTAAITDTINPYNVIISVRHTQQYPYQNMWLFVERAGEMDTIEFYLADQRGRWLGNGFGNSREMPVLYQRAVVFPVRGEYTYRIWQGMREDDLRGVQDIGLIIERE